MMQAERSLIERSKNRDCYLLAGLGAIAGFGIAVPVMFSNHLPNPVKSMLLLSGVVSSAAGAVVSRSPKLKKSIRYAQIVDEHTEKAFTKGLEVEALTAGYQRAHQLVYAESMLEMENDLRHLHSIWHLDPAQQVYYLNKWDKTGILPRERAQVLIGSMRQAMPQQQTVEAQAVEVERPISFEIAQPQMQCAETENGHLAATVALVQPTAKPQATASWIEDIAAKCAEPDPEKRRFQHLMVNGGSQSGKSTLFSKLLELLILMMSGIESGVRICLIDPKYPKTRWAIKPSFTGFESVESGVLTAADELDRRKQKCIDAEQFGEQHPDFPRYILIIDEWDSVWGEGNGYSDVITSETANVIRSNVLRILKEGAAYNVMVVVIGQSPLSGTTGFSRSDLSSACQIVLGVEALKWTQDSKFPFKDLKPQLQAEISGYLKESKRCALVVPNMELPYSREIPRLEISPIDVASVDSDADPIQPMRTIPKPQHNPEIKSRDLNQSNPSRDLFKALKDWYRRQSPKPSDEQIDSAFRQLSERSEPLPLEQINYLREQLEQ